jgi:hypothetical protein
MSNPGSLEYVASAPATAVAEPECDVSGAPSLRAAGLVMSKQQDQHQCCDLVKVHLGSLGPCHISELHFQCLTLPSEQVKPLVVLQDLTKARLSSNCQQDPGIAGG